MQRPDPQAGGWMQVQSSREGYGSKSAVLPMDDEEEDAGTFRSLM
jgi:hypothetical protein